MGARLRGPHRLLGEAVADELDLLAAVDEIPDLAKTLVVICGDLFDYPDLRKKGGTGPVDSVWAAFARVSKLVVGVLGNHDVLDPTGLPPNAALLDGFVEEFVGLQIGGIGGIIGRPDKTNRRAEVDYITTLRGLLRRQPDLVVLHPSPELPDAGLPGSAAVREVVLSAGEPTVVLSGHVHWPQVRGELGMSTVLNADGRVIVLRVEG